MKTIKQIADELNVSKQAVYKRYKGKLYTAVYPYTHTENNIVYIDEQGENIIKQDFLKEKPHTEAHTEHIHKPHTEHIQGYSGADAEYIPTQILDTLNKTIELLQNQLEEKDNHIKELTRLLDQSQHLQAQTTSKLPEPKAEEPGTVAEGSPEQDQEEKPTKKGILKKLFSRTRF